MNIFIRAISYDAPQDDYPSGGVVEFQDDVSEDLSLEEYGRDAWAFLESEIGRCYRTSPECSWNSFRACSRGAVQ